MDKVTLRQSTDEDLAYMIEHMRREDVDEILACGHKVDEAMHYGYEHSSHLWTILRDGKPIAIGGAIQSPVYEECAVIWMVSTDEINNKPVPVYRMVKNAINKMHEAYECLANYVDARNKGAVEMLRRIGFTIEAPEAHGPFGLPFHKFYQVAYHV